MVIRTLFHHLLEIDSQKQAALRSTEPEPNSERYVFLAKGHIMEVILIGEDERRIVSLFFEPDEMVVPSDAKFSHLESLDSGETIPFTYGTIIRTLRNFPETRIHYQEFRRRYQKKVADRLHGLESMSAKERFAHLKATQGWVFSLVDEVDIASYLGIPVHILRLLM